MTLSKGFGKGEDRQIIVDLYFARLVNKVLIGVPAELIFFDEEQEIVGELKVDFIESELLKKGITLVEIH